MAGTRRAREFLRAMESIVVCVGCVREELGPFWQISVRTGPIRIGAWNLSFLLPHLDLFLLQALYPSPCPSSPGKPSQSCVSKFATKSRKFTIFSDSRVHSFRHGLLPGPPGHCRLPPSSERVRFVSEYLYRAWMDSKLYRFGACRFRPGLIPQGTQGLQASAKGTACSRVLTRPESESSFDPLLRLPMTMSAP